MIVGNLIHPVGGDRRLNRDETDDWFIPGSPPSRIGTLGVAPDMRLYSCDVCGKTLDPTLEPRFAWKVEGGPVETDDEPTVLEGEDEFEGDTDSVEEMDELLGERETRHDEADSDSETLEMHPIGVRRSFDVCGGCYSKLIRDPLGRDSRKSARPYSRN